eukprot:scaffold495561_cov30-Prasinocladus_malaysianus.AAC.1
MLLDPKKWVPTYPTLRLVLIMMATWGATTALCHFLHPDFLDLQSCRPCVASVCLGSDGKLVVDHAEQHRTTRRDNETQLATATYHRDYE